MIKFCEYCNTPFNGRTNKKYCCIQCKRNDAKKRQRETQRVENEKEHMRSLVRQYRQNEINPLMVELYNKIYSK